MRSAEFIARLITITIKHSSKTKRINFMNNIKQSLGKFGLFIGSVLFIFTLAACGDGDAEEAGEKIDEIVTDAGNAVEDACENVKENADAKDQDC
jgi:hypothetical protein